MGALTKFNEKQWIGSASDTILAESAGFPHHLTNGCRALAQIVLVEGVKDVPPIEKLRHECKEHKREYYEARLLPWANHITALAHAFGDSKNAWTSIDDITRALKASNDLGKPVDDQTATTVLEHLPRKRLHSSTRRNMPASAAISDIAFQGLPARVAA